MTQQKACRSQNREHLKQKPNKRRGPPLSTDPTLPDGTRPPPTSHTPIRAGCVHSTQEPELLLPPLLPPVEQGSPLKGYAAALPGTPSTWVPSPPPPQRKQALDGMNIVALKALLPCLPSSPATKAGQSHVLCRDQAPTGKKNGVHDGKGERLRPSHSHQERDPDGQTHRQFSKQTMSTASM